MKKFALLLAGAILIPSMALAGNCPNLMSEIDKLLAEQPDLDASALVDEDSGKNVAQLRAEGEAMHASGDHSESVALLQKALDLIEESD